jgi:hypothetical protein
MLREIILLAGFSFNITSNSNPPSKQVSYGSYQLSNPISSGFLG